MSIWKAVKEECKEYGKRYPTWESFRNYFNRLKRLELVMESRTENKPRSDNLNPSTDPRPVQVRAYRFYKLNPRPPRYSSDPWLNPQKVCEEEFGWTPQADESPLARAIRAAGRR